MTKDREYFLDNLSMLIDSGMDLVTAMESLYVDARSKQLKKTVRQLIDDVENGSPLWLAMQKTKLLPAPAISLVKIGEGSGQLAENLSVISLQYQKQRDFKSKIRSAMMYPVIVLSLTFVIGIGIAWFILPKLANVFLSVKMELPLITKLLIQFGLFLSKYGAVFIPVVLVTAAVLFYFIFIFKRTKFIGQAIVFSLPVIKGLVMEVELARFGYLLGTLLEAGIPIIDALDSICDSTDYYFYKKLYRHLQDGIRDGNSFKKSFSTYPRSTKYIPYFIQQVIVAGENSGNLSTVLLKIGKIYEDKTEMTTKNISVLLEPILLIFIFIGVITVALAVILPIYSLVGGLNN